MKFDEPAERTPIDHMTVVGKPIPRIDGPSKVSGRAFYSYERNEDAPDAAYGYVLGAAIAKGRIVSIESSAAEASPGVIAIVTAGDYSPGDGKGFHAARPVAGPQVQHYHQAVALVVAETFEQARAATALIQVDYEPEDGSFDISAAADDATSVDAQPDQIVGDFDAAFAGAPVTIDATYTTPDQSHCMMEPHATIARWDGDEVTIWSAQQIIGWATRDLATALDVEEDKVRVVSSFVGGGFGGKGSVLADAVLAAIGARKAGRAVKVALPRPLMMNNTTHRAATVQRVRLGAERDGCLTAIAHESWSGNLDGGGPEIAAAQSKLLYAGDARLVRTRLAHLDLPEANAMRAPGEASGMMALEIAMDELAEKLGMDPVRLRIVNDTQVVPNGEEDPTPFSTRQLVRCLEEGADRFGWDAREARPGGRREGRWLIGMGMASSIRGAPIRPGGAQASLGADGDVTIRCDMTDIGTGSYTIVAQTAAEMMGVGVERVKVELGDTRFPESFGSGGQGGAATVTAAVYAACCKLRDEVARRLGFNSGADAEFAGGDVRSGNRTARLADAVDGGPIVVEDRMEYGDLSDRYSQQTFGGHFCEVAVDAYTGEIRVRRLLAVCAAGRILNPMTARSQVIGGMTMGIGSALTEELVVDTRHGFFVNHDLAQYEVPTHADVPHLEVHFVDELDPTMSPVKAKGVGELGLSGVAPAIANAVYNATGIRIRDYPLTLDKHLDRLTTDILDAASE